MSPSLPPPRSAPAAAGEPAESAGPLSWLRRNRGREALVSGLGLAAGCLVAWTPWGLYNHPALVALPLPCVVWIAARFGARGAAAASLLAAGIGGALTAAGLGPFATPSLLRSLGLLGIYLGVMAVTALFTAEVVEAERTAGHQRAEQLEIEKRAAEQTTRAKTEFLANVSHELRTPLNGIVGVIELMREMQLPTEASGWLELMDQSANHLRRVIDDLLDFSRIDAGHLTLMDEALDLRKLLRSVIRLLEPRATVKGLRLSLQVAGDVPVRILADRARLSQVLMNLLGNAVKFTESGGISLEVVRLAGSPPQLHFLVRDTGIGIAEEIRGKLFEAFSQADTSASRPYEGVGLGLAISRRIVQAMGGAIDFASNERNGTTFFFTLPERTTDRRDTPLLVKLPDLAAGSRVLLVDDNQVNRLVAAFQLHAMGLEVVEAESGIGALEALSRMSFAAVLLDCQMPELDGYDTARRIREQERQSGGHLTIIALTAHAGPEQRDKCLAAGMDDHLAKPFRREELAAVLHRWLPSAMLSAAKP